MSEVADTMQTNPVPQEREPPPSPLANEKDHPVAVTVTKKQNSDQDSLKEAAGDSPASSVPTDNFSSETSGNVVTPPELKSKGKVAPHSFVPFNRGRVMSLDRGRELLRVEIDDAYNSSDTTTDNEDGDRRERRTNGGSVTAPDSSPDDDDISSDSNTSDGESSYFAKHLPSPKSGRRFSLSSACSTSSAPARAGYYSSSNAHRESDASLSFSDDEEDYDSENVAPASRRSPLLPPTGKEQQDGAEEMQMYPQRITRMHSVSSLVSSSSEDGKHEHRQLNATSLSMSAESSDESIDTSTSDPSVRSELRDVASSKRRAARSRGSNRHSDVPSGRKSPIPPPEGELIIPSSDLIGRFFTSPPRHPQPSPPTIYQGYAPVNAQGIAHPQPQPLSSEQMAAWVAAGNAANHLMPPPPMFYPPVRYGATMMGGPPHSGLYPSQYLHGDPSSTAAFRSELSMSRSIMDSNTTLPLVYSDDEDDSDDGAKYGHQMSGGQRQLKSGGGGFNSAVGREKIAEGGNMKSGADDFMGPNLRSRQRGSRSRSENAAGGDGPPPQNEKGFQVYWRRWLMLIYMSVLNLMSDWTCYSVAPISILTSQAFGQINPELLVVVFLGANAVATACEPIILSRLGLRRTVIFGALLLMLGSIVKSGGLPPILQSELVRGKDEWRVYFGFFLVGLSQPLYQCTPALLSASWFPERERTMATGVALNANQLGIGCAFIFGTLLVAESDDIPKYFGLLSMISTITFMGCLIQFEDAPPTPPSETARIIRGTLELRFSSVRDMIWRSVRSIGDGSIARGSSRSEGGASSLAEQENPSPGDAADQGASAGADAGDSGVVPEPQPPSKRRSGASSSKRRSSGDAVRSSGSGRRSGRSSSSRKSSSSTGAVTSAGTGGAQGSRRRSGGSSRSQPASSDNGFRAGLPGMSGGPSPALLGGADQVARDSSTFEREPQMPATHAPSPMMHGRVGPPQRNQEDAHESSSSLYDNAYFPNEQEHHTGDESLPHGAYASNPYTGAPPGIPMNSYWQYPYWDMYSHQQGQFHHPGDPYVYPQMYPHMYPYDTPRELMNTGTIDDGAEPVLTITPHHLDINIRDDQIILSAKACFSRPGFVHALVAFTVSGIVINTLSTFMDYLVRLNGAGREYVGIVGGSFQFVIMISSLIVGKQTDKTRAYYSVIVGMLVMGAFGLAECGVSLDADRGKNLRWALVVVAALVGPLQPVSTELGVDVAYPLSENTVLVIQQLFSNLLSALFIPFFKAVRDIGTEEVEDGSMIERPQYTFSFYLLIVLHAAATVFFATFNGRYLRYEHEQEKKALEEAKQVGGGTAFSPVQGDFFSQEPYEEGDASAHAGERHALLHPGV